MKQFNKAKEQKYGQNQEDNNQITNDNQEETNTKINHRKIKKVRNLIIMMIMCKKNHRLLRINKHKTNHQKMISSLNLCNLDYIFNIF